MKEKKEVKKCDKRKHECFYIHYMNMLEYRIKRLEEMLNGNARVVDEALDTSRIFEALK